MKAKEKIKKVKDLAQKSKEYFQDSLGEFIYYRTYSRWIPDEQRRETWIETVNRYIDFMRETLGNKITKEKYKEIRDYIFNHKAMPSMRLIWAAGTAARATHVATYNCSYIALNKLKDFAEIMYLLMCGAGVGFSVENQNVQQFPIIQKWGKPRLRPPLMFLISRSKPQKNQSLKKT